MYGVSASKSSLLKLIKPQPYDIQSAAIWGTAALGAAVYLVQPFDWVRKTFFEKAEPQAN